ncbi:MAG: hypothetical protein KC493_12420 [Bacteriovoracaceae bacterium]|nr:hypothetical protein [Bacteriovoracaceae bacterium]
MNLKQRLQMELKEFQTLEKKYSFKRMKKEEMPEELQCPEDLEVDLNPSEND